MVDHFGPERQAAVESLVAEIAKSFDQRLNRQTWIDPLTRGRARTKLKMIATLIGYPTTWSQAPFEVSPKRYVQNVKAAKAFAIRRELQSIGKPVDRYEWEISPLTVNAFYTPMSNRIVFPAAIFQPPFFNPKANLAVNLGGIGTTIGHELTHAFDDVGSRFGARGKGTSWWHPETRQHFLRRAECFEKQYASYEPLPGLYVNGKLTLGENIADAGGVKLAFEALKRLRAEATDRVVAEGLSEEQQFFVSMGQVWCTKAREKFTRLRLIAASQAPSRVRVNGTLRNTTEFHEAFQCKPPTEMCSIW